MGINEEWIEEEGVVNPNWFPGYLSPLVGLAKEGLAQGGVTKEVIQKLIGGPDRGGEGEGDCDAVSGFETKVHCCCLESGRGW